MTDAPDSQNSDPETLVRTSHRPVRPTAWLGAVLFLSFLIYVPSVQNEFAWDDKQAAKAVGTRGRNPNVAELHPLSYYYTTGYWPNKDPGSPNYRPLTVLSFGLSHALFGERADVAHLLSILAHLLAVWLAYLVLRSLGGGWLPATLGALVFGVHSIHSEAVASVVGRAESLAFACGAAALLAIRAARHRQPGPQIVLLLGGAVALFAACSFKESGVAWAAFIPLSLWICSDKSGWGFTRAGRVGLAVAMLVPSVAFVALRHNFLSGIPPTAMGYLENPHLFTDFGTRVISSFIVWGYALAVTILPFRLGVDHGPSQFPITDGSLTDPWSWVGLLAAGVLFTLLVMAWRWRRRHPLFAMGIACFLGFSFIVSNIAFPIYVVFAERTYYTPSFGLSLVVCGLVVHLQAVARTRGVSVQPAWSMALGLWASFCVAKTWDRNEVWVDDLTMIAHEVLDHPRSLRLQIAAGALEDRRGEYVAAQARFEQALRLDPEEPRVWMGFAKVLFHRDHRAEAARALDHAADLPSHRFHPDLRQQLLILTARIHTVTGELEKVCGALEESVRGNPGYLGRATDLMHSLNVLCANDQIDAAVRRRLRALLQTAAVPGR